MISLPAMPTVQEASWHALFEVYAAYPRYWTLVGGQAVYIHAIDRGAPHVRPTTDADAGLDLRLNRDVLLEFTGTLVELGFKSAGTSPAGHDHRWVRGDAEIDVLIPRFTGPRSESRRGVTGGTTIAAPGLQQALRRSAVVTVEVGNRIGQINLTSFLGILIGKGAAVRIPGDQAGGRHLEDALILGATLRASDTRGVEFSPAEKAHLAYLTGHLAATKNRGLVESVDGGSQTLERLQLLTHGWSPADPNDRF